MTSETTSTNSTTQADTREEARSAAEDVAGTAKEQASQVAGETRRQARQLWEQSRDEMVQQGGQQQTRLASTLRDLGSELTGMASRSEQDGNATALVRDVGDHVSSAAGWLEDRQPGEVLEEVRSFARRRPGTFLLVAAGLGVLGGRLTRGAVEESRQSAGASGTASADGSGTNGAAPLTGPGVRPSHTDGTTPYAGGSSAYTGGDTAYDGGVTTTPAATQGRPAEGLTPRLPETGVHP